jgi:peptidoglycan-associated lipoprotein
MGTLYMNLRYKIALLGAMALIISACQSTDTVDTSTETEMEDASGASTTPVVVGPTPEEQAAQRRAEMLANMENIVYFDFDQSVLTPATRSILLQHAAYLRTNSDSIVLEGHADERGTREYNIALGERRSDAVANFLVLQGIGSNRIEVVSYGEERPAVAGSNEAAWSQNRRVEINY